VGPLSTAPAMAAEMIGTHVLVDSAVVMLMAAWVGLDFAFKNDLDREISAASSLSIIDSRHLALVLQNSM
jgi:hypothetical protein